MKNMQSTEQSRLALEAMRKAHEDERRALDSDNNVALQDAKERFCRASADWKKAHRI